MLTILIFIAALALIGQVFIGLTFFVSCIWEREKRATVFAGLQFSGMLALAGVFLFLTGAGLFEIDIGLTFLVGGLALGATASFLLMRRTAANPRALEGTMGLIVGNVKRHDERDSLCKESIYSAQLRTVSGILQRAP